MIEKRLTKAISAREVENVEEPYSQISLEDAREKFSNSELGDVINVEVTLKLGRIAVTKQKQVVVQKIREEERNVLFEYYYSKENDIVTCIVQRYVGKNISINIGKVDAILKESEQVKNEHFVKNERIKLYVLEVLSTSKGPRISVSRSHPN